MRAIDDHLGIPLSAAGHVSTAQHGGITPVWRRSSVQAVVQLAILSAPRRRNCLAAGSAWRRSTPGRKSPAGKGTILLADRSAAAAASGIVTVLPRIVTLAVPPATSWNFAALSTASSLVSA